LNLAGFVFNLGALLVGDLDVDLYHAYLLVEGAQFLRKGIIVD
jgi:hypothetical protein